jgi:SAM-dependent methyltransferase
MTARANWLPRRLVRALRNGYLAMLDVRDRIAGHVDDLTPPRALHFVGGGDFRSIGKVFLEHFKREAALRPSDSVLDIGCGTGRMAVPLLDYLDERGSYVGFDISRRAIDWCVNHISLRNTRFRFEHADIYNLEYNPSGAVRASAYRFPAQDSSIDFAFATSVFTHIHSDEVRHYFAELRRVLSPAGRAFLTFFALEGKSGELAAQRAPAMDFRFPVVDGKTIDPHTPERAIAYPTDWIADALGKVGLNLVTPIRYGSWSGRTGALDFQDILLVRRKPAP